MPPYSASPSSTSSPASRASERTTAFSAELAFVANVRFPGAAPTYQASCERAPSRSFGKRRSSAQELDRLALELALKALVGLEYGPRARAERPVVQEHHGRVEEEQILHRP